MHRQVHIKRSENNFWYKCSKPNCRSTFGDQESLIDHMRIRNNELDTCQYCPYRYVRAQNYSNHLAKHFGIKDYQCEHCGMAFSTKGVLFKHSSKHEGIIYSCLICNTYESPSKSALQYHLRNKHSDLLGKNINWDSVKKYVKTK